jgi:hypothetical protein
MPGEWVDPSLFAIARHDNRSTVAHRMRSQHGLGRAADAAASRKARVSACRNPLPKYQFNIILVVFSRPRIVAAAHGTADGSESR